MNKKTLLILIGVIMVILGVLYTQLHVDTSKQSPSTVTEKPSPSNTTGMKVGQTLTPFILEDLNGSQVTVGQSGKITVINFWATWCPPCKEEMPELEIFAHENQDKVDFYAVNLLENSGKINDFMSKNKFTMPVLLDKDGAVGKRFQVTAIPTTIIVNKQGMVKFRKSGAMTRVELEGIIKSL